MVLTPAQPRDWLLPNLIDHRARTEPDSIWTQYPASPSTYDDGFKTVTYADFANAVNGAAAWLEKTLGGKGHDHEVLAYLGPNDVRYIIFIVAAVKAGYAMLLISPRNSLAAQKNLLQETGCSKLVSSSPVHPAMQVLADETKLPVYQVPAVSELLDTKHPHYPYDKEYAESKKEPLVVLHTSGSTGLPKSLVYTHEFATTYQRVFVHPAPEGYYGMNSLFRGNRMFFMLPPFHASGVLMHLMNAVYNKTIIITPTALTPPTARSLAEALKHVPIDVAFGTPLTCLELNAEPELLDFIASKLDTFFYAGGDCPKAVGDHINKKIKLFTIIGYTECGNLPQIRPVGPWSDEWKYIQIDPSVNAEMRHSHDDLYQHWIVRKPECERQQTPFILFPELQEYTSKDLFSPHPTKPGLWTHRGRADDIIVFLNGEKTNPVSFEATIASAPNVSGVLVVGAQRFQAALLIEPKTPLDSVVARAEALEQIWPFIAQANAACPAHARVARSHVLFTKPELPMLRAGKGTVQRGPTVSLYKEDINSLYDDADKQALTTSTSVGTIADVSIAELQKAIRENVMKVTQWSSLEDADDFFVRGMDSLQVLLFIRSFKAIYMCESLAPSIVYTNRTVDSLAQAIKGLSADEGQTRVEETARFRQEVEESVARHLADLRSLPKSTGQKPSTQATQRTVLLTGSTGAIGCYLLQALLSNPDVEHIYCLNRSPDSADLQTQRNQIHALPASWDTTRVTHLTGDLSLPSFGLSDAQYQNLANNVTETLHVAWPVNFNKPLATFEPSLRGVVQLVDFSLHALHAPRLVYISSVSAVFGTVVSGQVATVPESLTEDASAAAQTGYGASKHVAERLLSCASAELGVSTTILRVGQVAGPAQGEGTWAAQEWLPSLVISGATVGALPADFGSDGTAERGDVDWVPIDVLARVILDLSLPSSTQSDIETRKAPAPEIYHLCNPYRTTWSSLLPTVQKCASAATGREVQVVPFAAWIEKVKAAGKQLLDGPGAAGVDAISKLPAIKILDFYEALASRPVTGKGAALLETSRAERDSESLRGLGQITAGMMERWVGGWKLI